MLLNFVKKIWDQPEDTMIPLVMADWIDDYIHHPEKDSYIKKIRMEELTIGFMIDLVIKLGTRKERRIISKFKRLVKKNLNKMIRFGFKNKLTELLNRRIMICKRNHVLDWAWEQCLT